MHASASSSLLYLLGSLPHLPPLLGISLLTDDISLPYHQQHRLPSLALCVVCCGHWHGSTGTARVPHHVPHWADPDDLMMSAI